MATAAAIGLVTEAARSDSEVDATIDADPEEAFARAEIMATVRGALAELSSVEREIVTRHYLDAESMGVIATDLNVSKSWISRVHTRAIARLTKKLQSVAQ
jgi:RNA polymerase sigma factor (sigma-70 family)